MIKAGFSAIFLWLVLAGCEPDGTIITPQSNSCETTPVFDAPPLNMCRGSRRVRLTFAGDVLLHRQLQQIGYAGGFPALWAQAAPFLRDADIAIANLEGPVAPGMTRMGVLRGDPGPIFGTGVYTGYPTFNYHPMILAALHADGVDLVTTANNHAMDRGSVGANMTLDEIENAGLMSVGTVRAEGERNFVWRQKTALGNIAFIACSFSTNGMPDRQHQVLMCYEDRDTLLELVQREAADRDVAAVVVLPHWGLEYQSYPEGNQKALTLDLVNAGATAVIGTHPHAVQPFVQLPNPQGQMVPVAYSTGNFVAAQHSMPANVGALAIVDLCTSAEGGGVVADRFGWIAAQMVFTSQAFWLNIAPRGTEGVMAKAYDHVSRVAPGYSAQPQSCEAN